MQVPPQVAAQNICAQLKVNAGTSTGSCPKYLRSIDTVVSVHNVVKELFPANGR